MHIHYTFKTNPSERRRGSPNIEEDDDDDARVTEHEGVTHAPVPRGPQPPFWCSSSGSRGRWGSTLVRHKINGLSNEATKLGPQRERKKEKKGSKKDNEGIKIFCSHVKTLIMNMLNF